MKTQIKPIGTSKGIILSTEFLKFHKLKIGDWVDISDLVKVSRR
jgi:hypothetical protein